MHGARSRLRTSGSPAPKQQDRGVLALGQRHVQHDKSSHDRIQPQIDDIRADLPGKGRHPGLSTSRTSGLGATVTPAEATASGLSSDEHDLKRLADGGSGRPIPGRGPATSPLVKLRAADGVARISGAVLGPPRAARPRAAASPYNELSGHTRQKRAHHSAATIIPSTNSAPVLAPFVAICAGAASAPPRPKPDAVLRSDRAARGLGIARRVAHPFSLATMLIR